MSKPFPFLQLAFFTEGTLAAESGPPPQETPPGLVATAGPNPQGVLVFPPDPAILPGDKNPNHADETGKTTSTK